MGIQTSNKVGAIGWPVVTYLLNNIYCCGQIKKQAAVMLSWADWDTNWEGECLVANCIETGMFGENIPGECLG